MGLLTFSLIFSVVILAGLMLSIIRVRRISLGFSGVLIAAVAAGFLMTICFGESVFSKLNDDFSALSGFGTAIFVSCIGLAAGYEALGNWSRKSVGSVFAGVFMVTFGYGLLRIMMLFLPTIEPSLILGIFCGAMTSTPGLSSACGNQNVSSELAALGYSYSYLFGVVGTVLFVQIVLKKTSIEQKLYVRYPTDSLHRTGMNVLFPICLAIASGELLGKAKLFMSEFSIGSSGGVLVAAFLIGILMRKHGLKCCLNLEAITSYRMLGLGMFFVGTGVPAGQALCKDFNIIYLLFGIPLTVFPIFVGYVIVRIVMKRDRNNSAFLIAGGMTSTPAVAVAMEKEKQGNSLPDYSLAYLGALFVMVILMAGY